MQLFSTTRLTSAFAMGAFGLLAACSPRKEQTTDTLATTPPAAATTPAAGETTSAWTDANVVDVITVANQGEIDYSQLGVEKATNPSVKQFAQLMVKDHGTMLDGVKSLATKLNLTPAPNDKVSDLQKENQKDISDLNGKTVGKDFDKEFMEEQVDMHQETLDLLNDLDGKTTNADLNPVRPCLLPVPPRFWPVPLAPLHLRRPFVVAKPEKHRLTEKSLVRPLGVFDLAHNLRLDPGRALILRHRPLTGWRRAPDRIQIRVNRCEFLPSEPAPGPAAVDQFPVNVLRQM